MLGSAGRNHALTMASHWPLRHFWVQAALSSVSKWTSTPTSFSWAWMTWAMAMRSALPARLSITKEKRCPSFSRTPSGPATHPASSSMRRARSGSILVARHRPGCGRGWWG